MKYLAERLTAFLKDYDYFDNMDSMEIGETDADMVEKNKAMLNVLAAWAEKKPYLPPR